MDEKRLEIAHRCSLTFTKYESFPPQVELHYTEHSSDPWYSNMETYHDIDRELAIKIIEFLKEAHDL